MIHAVSLPQEFALLRVTRDTGRTPLPANGGAMRSLTRARCWVLALLALPVATPAAGYDPLAVAAATPERVDLVARDASRSRDIPLRVYLPTEKTGAPVVLFSHGLGGSRENSPYLGEHWARRGYVAVFLQHPGSDEAVWKGQPASERLLAMTSAASLENFLLRVRDVPAALDALEVWHRTTTHPLAGRLDFGRVGMSGHSFGAVTTQAVSGQGFALAGPFTEKRIRAAVLMSPSVPRRGDPKRAFSEVEIPWLLLTGTHDEAVIGGATPESRLGVYPALPPGGKYELVLHGAEHSAFSDRPLPGDREARNPNHHRAILALTTAFWDAYLRDDTAARQWLDGDGPRGVFEKEDRWQHK